VGLFSVTLFIASDVQQLVIGVVANPRPMHSNTQQNLELEYYLNTQTLTKCINTTRAVFKCCKICTLESLLILTLIQGKITYIVKS